MGDLLCRRQTAQEAADGEVGKLLKKQDPPAPSRQATAGGQHDRDEKSIAARFIHDDVVRQAVPHTSRAVSATSLSLAISSSMVMVLPPMPEEKPHCGDKASCSSGA